jgi:glutaminyl-tRNA synthetase
MNNNNNSKSSEKTTEDFIRYRIKTEMEAGRYEKVHTRFPPEPNGYLHIGHAKAICVNFDIAEEFSGKCNLRFDDTNPIKEETKYVEGIINDIMWLGYNWEDRLYYASDYFGQLYKWAIMLIKDGNAYVDDLSANEIREHRGTLTEPGKESPYRNRSVDENLELFEKMKKGDFPDGSKTLRAKIDMSAGNMNMRDPVMYRVLHAEHHRIGNEWCIYPTYDWAHGQSDSIEGVTYSLCDLDFEDHRPLYDWFLDKLGVHQPQQIEFARLNITYTILSKRKLIQLVDDKIVDGWDDPRMPTLSGFRRRGYTSRSIRTFIDKVGVAKKRGSIADIALLEHGLREELNITANRTMAVLNPLKVVITNYPDDKTEEFRAENNPEDDSAGTRIIPFSKEIYIEQDDFMENPPKKFFRLAPGREVRLKHTYFITCNDVIKDETGEIKELHCTYDPDSRGGSSPDGRKVKGTLHWVSAKHAIKSEARLYDHLFNVENPAAEDDFMTVLNPNSKTVLNNCMIEPHLKDVAPGTILQFLRNGYFSVDTDSTPDNIVFNRTVSLRDSWAKLNK